MQNDEAAALAIVLIVAGISIAVSLAVQAVVCWLVSKWLGRVPAEHRKQTPGKVWLLMIPVFGVVWNFFVYPRIADSFDSYFRSKNEAVPSIRGLASGYCWVVVAAVLLSWVPCAGPLIALGALIMLILLLVKISGLAGKMPAAA